MLTLVVLLIFPLIPTNLEYIPENLNDSITAIDDEKVDFNKKIEPFINGILNSDEFFSPDGVDKIDES